MISILESGRWKTKFTLPGYEKLLSGDFKPPIIMPDDAVICSNCNYSDLKRSKDSNSCENYFDSCEWHMQHNTNIISLPEKCKDYVVRTSMLPDPDE